MTKQTLPKPPAGLSRKAAAFWRKVLVTYELGPAGLELLASACRALDRAEQAAAVLAEEGITSLDRYGSPKAHPACEIEARSCRSFAAFVRQLGIETDDDTPSPASAPRVRYGAKPGPRGSR
jgi:P27 family predicted phage terminase small subunit